MRTCEAAPLGQAELLHDEAVIARLGEEAVALAAARLPPAARRFNYDASNEWRLLARQGAPRKQEGSKQSTCRVGHLAPQGLDTVAARI